MKRHCKTFEEVKEIIFNQYTRLDFERCQNDWRSFGNFVKIPIWWISPYNYLSNENLNKKVGYIEAYKNKAYTLMINKK